MPRSTSTSSPRPGPSSTASSCPTRSPSAATTRRWCSREDDAVSVFNHMGQCVTDLDRSRRFYVDVLGFEPWREIQIPDGGSDKLLRLSPPIGLTACYLRRDGFVLELLHYAGSGAAPRA